MALQNAGRPATARPMNGPPTKASCWVADGPVNPTNQAARQAQKLRRQRQVCHLWHLGEAPLYNLLTDLDAGKPVWPAVEEYAALPADFIKALGGDRFAPVVHVIDEDGP